MAKNITVAKNWKELNNWQLQEIANIYLSITEENFAEVFPKMVFILFQKKKNLWAKIKLYRLLHQVSFDDLAFHAKFLLETTNFHSFPKIKGLLKPADRIADFTAKHFAFADKFFEDYTQDKTLLSLQRFVASLYKITPEFNELRVSDVAKITNKLSLKEMQVIALAYRFTRIHIWQTYPIIFPKKEENTEEEKFAPVFETKNTYQSFDKVITNLVFTEEKPLGNKKEADNTNVYTFLNVFQETIIRFKNKEKK